MLDRERVLSRVKGFRNVLVHEYGDVDDERVFDYLRNRLGDFSTFRAAVVATVRGK